MHNGKIWITDWKGNCHEMTPNKLLERIQRDSKSNWNWLAPASEIVKTISDPDFPEEMANELKIIVLRCFANILLSETPGYEKDTDQIAVAYCYYSAHGKSAQKVKRLYRKNILKAATRATRQQVGLSVYGAEWHKFCANWQKTSLQNFNGCFGTDFMRFGEKARKNFVSAAKKAKAAGTFAPDEAEHLKILSKIFSNL